MTTHHKSAGFWVRFAAFGIDAGLFVLAFVVWVFLVGVAGEFFRAGPAFVGTLLTLGILGVWAGHGFYTVLMTRGMGQTLGKRLLGLRVVCEGEAPPATGESLRRWLGYHLTALTGGIGFAAAAFSPGHKSLQDFVAGTRVIRVGPAPLWLQSAGTLVGLLLALVPLLGAAVVKKGIRNMETAEIVSKEADARAGLEMLRRAVSDYTADRGASPQSLLEPDFLGVENNLASVPELDLPFGGHRPSQAVETGRYVLPDSRPDPAAMRDTGHWAYDPAAGTVFVDCTHLDSEGAQAYTW